jgi:hypothetical protein
MFFFLPTTGVQFVVRLKSPTTAIVEMHQFGIASVSKPHSSRRHTTSGKIECHVRNHALSVKCSVSMGKESNFENRPAEFDSKNKKNYFILKQSSDAKETPAGTVDWRHWKI